MYLSIIVIWIGSISLSSSWSACAICTFVLKNDSIFLSFGCTRSFQMAAQRTTPWSAALGRMRKWTPLLTLLSLALELSPLLCFKQCIYSVSFSSLPASRPSFSLSLNSYSSLSSLGLVWTRLSSLGRFSWKCHNLGRWPAWGTSRGWVCRFCRVWKL